MSARKEQRIGFLQSSNWGDAELVAFAQDASFRRYFRLQGGPSPALLMDAPPQHESIDAFVDISRHLRSLGLSAPQIYASDTTLGFCLLEDFGDDTFTRLLAEGHNQRELYTLAIDCLLALQKHPDSAAIDVPLYRDYFIPDLMLFCQWGFPELTGDKCKDEAVASYRRAWQITLDRLSRTPDVLILRDFHVDNAMLLRERINVARCGLLDFQDARKGPGLYDLISLLEDARRDIDDTLRSDCLQYYRQHISAIDEDRFTNDYAIIAAQRHCRILAIFTRLAKRDGKHHYLEHLPRVTRLLCRHLQHPVMSAVADWFEEHCAPIDDPGWIGDLLPGK